MQLPAPYYSEGSDRTFIDSHLSQMLHIYAGNMRLVLYDKINLWRASESFFSSISVLFKSADTSTCDSYRLRRLLNIRDWKYVFEAKCLLA